MIDLRFITTRVATWNFIIPISAQSSLSDKIAISVLYVHALWIIYNVKKKGIINIINFDIHYFLDFINTY